MGYMHNNPVWKNFAEKPEHWKCSSARNRLPYDDSVIAIDRQMVFREGQALPI